MAFKDSVQTLKAAASADQIIDQLGLQRRREPADLILPALGLFGVGIGFGFALGMLFAPKPGQELRQDIRTRIDTYRHPRASADLPEEVEERAGNPYVEEG